MIEIKLTEKQEIVDGLEIKYMFKPATLDVEHLIVIFSGYGAKSLYTYDFAGDSLKDIPSNILWIKDEFGGAPVYYMCRHRDFSIEKNVIKFIDKIISDLSLSRSDVTILGASKGGTAALYYGIKYNFKNIISSAPQFDLGSFLSAPERKLSYEEMVDSEKDDNVGFFNDLLYSEISKTISSEAKIYLIYSECDELTDYTKAIDLLKKKFSNFSTINVNSPLVSRHNRITSYSVLLIKSILLQNAYKFSPYIKNLKIGLDKVNGDNYTLNINQLNTECYLENFLYNPKSLQLKIINIHRLSNADKSNTRYFLCLVSNTNYTYKFELKNVIINRNEKPDYERKYYLYSYYDLSQSCFELANPLDLSNIKPSMYNINILILEDGKSVQLPLVTLSKIDTVLNKDNGILAKIFSYRDNSIKLYISPDVSNYEPDIFKITQRVIDKSLFLYEGYFIKYGLICDDYLDLDYYLVFKNCENSNSTRIRIGKGNNKKLNQLFNGECFISKNVFTNIGRKSLQIGKDVKLHNGEYDVFVSMVCLSHVFSHKFVHWNVIDNVIVSENLYNEKKDLVTQPDLDKYNISELMLMSEQLVVLSILDYIRDIKNQIPINILKYLKIRQYLINIENSALLNYLQFSIKNLLQDDLYKELK